MSNDTVENKLDKKILEEAADYYLTLQDGTMSNTELRAWQNWFLNSREHRVAFRRLETLWGKLDQLDISDLEAHGPTECIETTSERPANFAGGSVLSLVTENNTEQPPQNTWHSKYAAIAACFVSLFMAGYLLYSPSTDLPSPPAIQAYATVTEDQQLVKLSDSSIVELGPDSKIEVQYSNSSRTVRLLEGQAIFTVAKNPHRPFIVEAGDGTVTAIGTVFNVIKAPEGVVVKVLEGTVAVRSEEENTETTSSPVALVTAGNETSYSKTEGLAEVRTVDVHEGLEWRVGVLRMLEKPLDEVIEELNRYVEKEIRIGDKEIGDYSFTGTVYPDQVDNWLEGLQQGYPLKVVRVGSSIVLMKADEQQ
ncbi:FecR family protein [Kordiimonas sp. SCSIO 12603]|uniref:FecR family protein n=1 Tax=Kordiimonas sp. SCSIO 12603 TaxID=2829596 RepID=UPI002104D53E|nr:FecR family protein [Kordiimonas sp. SCSIO 12603]UTW58286.1 FecR family protein [Kordiimonas sp. SCSIO 12603]